MENLVSRQSRVSRLVCMHNFYLDQVWYKPIRQTDKMAYKQLREKEEGGGISRGSSFLLTRENSWKEETTKSSEMIKQFDNALCTQPLR